jgi:FixJ family two-component response regulator
MDGMSGMEPLKTPTMNPLPVIVITGRPEGLWRDRALQGGAVGFMQKRFDAKNLPNLIAKSIRTHRGTTYPYKVVGR